HLWRTPGEVDGRLFAVDCDLDLEANRDLEAVRLEGRPVAAVRDLTQRLAHGSLGARLDLEGERVEGIETVLAHQTQDPLLHQVEGGQLGPQVTDDLIGHAHVLAEQLYQRGVQAALVHQLHDGDLEALLEHLSGLWRPDLATDIWCVSRAGREPDEPALVEDGLRDGDVRQMPGALVDVVRHVDIVGADLVSGELGQEVLHRPWQRADERRDAPRSLD